MENCVEWWITKWYVAPDERAIIALPWKQAYSPGNGRPARVDIWESEYHSSTAHTGKNEIRAGSRPDAYSSTSRTSRDSRPDSDHSYLPPGLTRPVRVERTVSAPGAP